MSDAATFIILCAALLIDVCRLLWDWLGDRLAFLGYVAAIAAGFVNSGLFQTVEGLINGVCAFPKGIWNIPITRGLAIAGPQVIGILVILIAVGAMVPARWTRLLGTLATLNFQDLKGVIPARGPQAIMKGPPGAAPMPGGRGLLRRIFGGQVNLGMVALALLLVVTGSMVNGWTGEHITSFLNWDMGVMGKAAGIILKPVGA